MTNEALVFIMWYWTAFADTPFSACLGKPALLCSVVVGLYLIGVVLQHPTFQCQYFYSSIFGILMGICKVWQCWALQPLIIWTEAGTTWYADVVRLLGNGAIHRQEAQYTNHVQFINRLSSNIHEPFFDCEYCSDGTERCLSRAMIGQIGRKGSPNSFTIQRQRPVLADDWGLLPSRFCCHRRMIISPGFQLIIYSYWKKSTKKWLSLSYFYGPSSNGTVCPAFSNEVFHYTTGCPLAIQAIFPSPEHIEFNPGKISGYSWQNGRKHCWYTEGE